MKKYLSSFFQLFEKNMQRFSSDRQDAWEDLNSLDFEKAKENYPYLPLENLFSEDLRLAEKKEIEIEKDLKGLVFIDGFFAKDISEIPTNVLINPLAKASFFKKKEFFSLLNFVFHSEQTVIHIPAKTKLKEPIEITYYFSNQAEKRLVFPKILVTLGEEAEAEFHFSIKTKTSQLPLSFSPSFEVILEKDSKLSCYSNLDSFSSIQCFDLYHFMLHENANLHFFDFSKIGSLRYLQGWVDLLGKHSKASLESAVLLDKNFQNHMNFYVNHEAKKTISSQKHKSILLDEAKSSLRGDVFIASDAEESSSSQVNHNLLLSDTAFVYSQPKLRIFNDNVKATHGATVSQLKDDELFYLESRGMDKVQAKQLLMKAFAIEMIDFVKDNRIKEKVRTNISQYLEKAGFNG